MHESHPEEDDEKLKDHHEQDVLALDRLGEGVRKKRRDTDGEVREYSSLAKVSQWSTEKDTQYISDPTEEYDRCRGHQGKTGKMHEGDDIAPCHGRVHDLKSNDHGQENDGRSMFPKDIEARQFGDLLTVFELRKKRRI